jgi:hypothetical protein
VTNTDVENSVFALERVTRAAYLALVVESVFSRESLQDFRRLPNRPWGEAKGPYPSKTWSAGVRAFARVYAL